MTTATQTHSTNDRNGLKVENITKLASQIQQHEDYGKFQFRAVNSWINGAVTRSHFKGFFAGGKEDTSRTPYHHKSHAVTTDQPAFLAGSNTGANPVEHLLHALGSCLTTTLVYHASVQGIDIEAVATSCTGDMDARGFFGLSDTVSKGYKTITVNMQVKSDASVEALTECALHSPVYEMLSKAIDVEFTLTSC